MEKRWSSLVFSDPSKARKASARLLRALTCPGAPGRPPASTPCLRVQTGLMSESSKIGFPRALGPLRAAKSRLSAVLAGNDPLPSAAPAPPGTR